MLMREVSTFYLQKAERRVCFYLFLGGEYSTELHDTKVVPSFNSDKFDKDFSSLELGRPRSVSDKTVCRLTILK